jgi:hypothetical protein
MQTLTVAEKSKGGNLAFVYEFTADEGKLQQMTSNGEIFLEHIDYQMLPVIAKIMSTVLLKDAEAQKTVHAYGAFTIDELIATLQHGRLANDWIAIEALPGVRLDLQTGDFDGYFFVAPIKQIHQVLHKIPVVRLFVDLKSNLVRLRVKGNHSDPSTIQVTKEPLRDVTKGTLEFVQGVAGTGGGFIKGLKDTPGILLKDREN